LFVFCGLFILFVFCSFGIPFANNGFPDIGDACAPPMDALLLLFIVLALFVFPINGADLSFVVTFFSFAPFSIAANRDDGAAGGGPDATGGGGGGGGGIVSMCV